MGKEAEQEKLTNEQASKATKRNEDEQVTNNTEQASNAKKNTSKQNKEPTQRSNKRIAMTIT